MASGMDQPMPTVGEKRGQPEGDDRSDDRARKRGPFLRPLGAQGMSDRARMLQELDLSPQIALRTLAFGPDGVILSQGLTEQASVPHANTLNCLELPLLAHTNADEWHTSW
jgi:hypothetical protein